MNQEYFMGSSTAKGFKTDFYDEHSEFYGYFIKGGPGTGKSTIMRKLAESFPNEKISYYYCSSDPASLDAIVFENKKIYFADATSPHAADPKLPYISGEIVNLAESLNEQCLDNDRAEICLYNNKNQLCHTMAKRCLGEIAVMQENVIGLGRELSDRAAIDKFISGFCREYLNGIKTEAKEVSFKQRISITPYGKRCLLPKECRLVILKDENMYLSLYCLKKVKEYALEMGARAEITKSVTQRIFPETMIYFSDIGLAVCAEQNLLSETEEKASVIFDLKEHYKNTCGQEINDFVKMSLNNIEIYQNKTVEYLAKALAYHNDLESYYIKAIDKKWLDKKLKVLLDILK